MNEMYLTPEDYEIAEKNGIHKALAYDRFYTKGWTKKKAITEPVRVHAGPYQQYKHVCNENGISRELFNERIKRNWTHKEASEIPPLKKTDRLHQRKTIIAKEIRELAKKNGIPKGTLEGRIYNYKWNPHRAATEPVESKHNWRKNG